MTKFNPGDFVYYQKEITEEPEFGKVVEDNGNAIVRVAFLDTPEIGFLVSRNYLAKAKGNDIFDELEAAEKKVKTLQEWMT